MKVHLVDPVDLLRIADHVEWPTGDARQEDAYVKLYVMVKQRLWDNESWRSYLALPSVIRETLLAPIDEMIWLARDEAVNLTLLWQEIKRYLNVKGIALKPIMSRESRYFGFPEYVERPPEATSSSGPTLPSIEAALRTVFFDLWSRLQEVFGNGEG